MPKVSQNSNHTLSSSPISILGTHPNVLKRNQACHQCRRRKLKCDARRPCSTCIRSHAHAVSHAPPGTQLPATPECTFDDVAETNAVANEGPKSRYERLENRINELETLLLQKEKAESSGLSTDVDALSMRYDSQQSIIVDVSVRGDSPNSSSHTVDDFSPYQSVTSASPGNPKAPLYQPVSLSDPVAGPEGILSNQATLIKRSFTPTESPIRQDVIWSHWPPRLPEPELLHHLVEVFFVFHPHANRLLHASSFMTSLSLPPSHPRFPATPVLHAICAMGSLYTSAVSSPPLPNFQEIAPDEIFTQKQRVKEDRPDSFAEQQAKYARETADRSEKMGDDLFQVLQADIIISWFYWSHSRWVDVFLYSAHSLRLSVPLGLNMCPPFHSITRLLRPPSILPPARTVIEDETRRNAFWLAYATERLHLLGNGWALSLDDQDVSQLLPVRGDHFEQGTLITPHERQWAHSKDLLLVHINQQTDSFTLYIKGAIMISRIKTFNSRFRARHFAGDPSVASSKIFYNESNNPSEPIDPRGSPAFIELDEFVSSFRASFPSHLKNPINDNVVDSHLYTTCLMPHTAAIILHEPHADVRHSGCLSALKILTAARSILDLIYNVWSTSYDISLLDSFCTFCWFVAGRVLVRFLQAALDSNTLDQISTIKAEVEFVQLAIAKVGERIPLAFRFAKLLDDLVHRCGPASTLPLAISFPRQPRLLDNRGLDPTHLFDGVCLPNDCTLLQELDGPESFT